MTNPFIDINDLRIRLGEQVLVDGVNLSVRSGERLGIVGESGSGKSLTCRSLVGGLTRLGMEAEGQVMVDRSDLLRCSTKTWIRLRRKTIGFVPQSSLNSLDPLMRTDKQLDETVSLHLRNKRDRAERVRELLDLVHMADPERVLRSYAHQLSGGMRQRLMIALAVAGNPSVLVADEPTTALDVSVQRKILDLLDEVCRQTGMALVLVTHDFGIVDRLCDKVVVMREGRVIEAGSTRDVLGAPKSSYTKTLLEARLPLPGKRPSSTIEGGHRQ